MHSYLNFSWWNTRPLNVIFFVDFSYFDGLVYQTDHVFWKTYYPPNGWKCRCDVVQMNDEDLAKYELTPNL